MKTSKGEKVNQQSAAEFFSEHQQIAGFDNPGKSLYTTIRELVENSLDASESIHVLPEIKVKVVEYNEEEHNLRHGISIKKNSNNDEIFSQPQNDANFGEDNLKNPSSAKKKKVAQSKVTEAKAINYYDISCCDNGCGIAPENIGNMLGRVLSGSKHGVRQTRGKFGLGAKMALIWSKKSSGLPITVRTAYSPSPNTVPQFVTTVVLDIDIYKNEPRILSKKTEPNELNWRGCEISVTISGAWSTYRSRILMYFQQLAVITPYADLSLDFECSKDVKKNFTACFTSRSEQMPPVAKEVAPHPKSLNHITLSRMLKQSKERKLTSFLCKELNGITTATASKISTAVGDNSVDLSSSKVTALCQSMRDDKSIKPPTAHCLSPAGEYNMRLGVLKEHRPKLIATFTDKPGSHEGHPFLVEAAVSVGGSEGKEGCTIYRFANRIPLLFETGADVVTQVATKKINWSSYHIDMKRDNVGVYVSIVSTKIPFKGTSKEYIGEDVIEIQQSVRRALIGCCQQLRVSLAQNKAKKEEQDRKKNLEKYIPNISTSLFTVLDKMNEKRKLGEVLPGSHKKGIEVRTILDDLSEGNINSKFIASKLQSAVDHLEAESILQAAANDALSGSGKRQKFSISEYYQDSNFDPMNSFKVWSDILEIKNVKILV